MLCRATPEISQMISNSAVSSFRRITLALVLCGLSLLLVSCSSEEDDSWSRVQETGVLRVGLDPTFPPFENADTGELHGIDVDLARAIADKLDVEVQFAYFGYDGLYDALATDRIDVLISALFVDESKTRDFAYGEPYFNAGQFLVVHQRQAQAITEPADLSGKILAVELGSEGHVLATQWERQIPDLTILPLPAPDDALWVVLQQEADAAVVDQVSGRLYRRQAPDLILQPRPVTVEPYAFAVRLSDDELLELMDDALAELKSDGTLDQIMERWLDN